MTKLTLEQFGEQWAPGGHPSNILTYLEFDIFNFTTVAGEAAKAHFESSFERRGFAGIGATWPSRKSRWGRKFHHPVMNDTGTLKGSLKTKEGKKNYGSILKRGAKSKSASYTIWTAERSSAEKCKRGTSSKSDGSYAAVHNTNPYLGLYYVNQWAAAHNGPRPKHRQFMGHSKALDAQVARLIPMIFRRMPGDFK